MSGKASKAALETIDTLPALTARAAALWPERTGLIFDASGERLSFGDIERRSNAVANALAGLGIGLGDTVGVMLRNVAAFPLAWLALQKIGATMVPLNVFYKRNDAAYLLEHSEAKAIVTADEFVPLFAEIAADGGPAPLLISTDGNGGGRAQPIDVTAADESLLQPVPDPTRLANIQYTSGTTGRPKGCMLSNRYWVAIARKIGAFGGIGEDDVMLTAQPFYYMDPQWNVACALAAGCPLVVLDRFHPTTFWEKARAHCVTWFYCLGTMPLMLLNTLRQSSDTDNLVRMVMCSAIPPGRHAEIEQRWGAPWLEAFGMTETGGDLAVSLDEHDELVGTGSIGRPMPDREARAVDDADDDVPAGTVGELVLRGPDMMDGYFKNQEATAEIFRGGWLHTGDLVKRDAAGRFYYVGRKKEMIRRSSENISAAEVEETIASHSAVRIAACVPVPDEVRGEEVKAYVVLRDGTAAEPVELNAYCAERLAYFKVPRYWTFVDDLPRTPSERVAKHVLVGGVKDLRAGAWDRVDDVWR